MKEITPKIEKELNKEELIEKLEKSYRQDVNLPRLTADYIEETLQIA